MKKKFISTLLVISILLIILSGCSSSSNSDGKEQVVNVYNWGEYIDESIFDDFTEQTGIKVNYTTYATCEEMYAKLKSGSASYDVIIPSDYMIGRMIEEDMLEKIDFDNVPNYDDINDRYKSPVYDPTGEYSVPYMWGTVGIIYNSTMVDGDITSWSALFDEEYSGQILMFDNSRDAIGIALKYLGYSYNTTDESQLNEALELLKEQKPLVQAYVMDQIFDKMIAGEAAIAPYYAGDFETMYEENSDLRFVVPEEGSNLFVDAMCIPKGAENKENAEAFINFMCSTDVGLANCDVTYYSSPLDSVIDALPEEIRSNEALYPSDEILNTCETYQNLPSDTLTLYDSIWVELKSD